MKITTEQQFENWISNLKIHPNTINILITLPLQKKLQLMNSYMNQKSNFWNTFQLSLTLEKVAEEHDIISRFDLYLNRSSQKDSLIHYTLAQKKSYIEAQKRNDLINLNNTPKEKIIELQFKKVLATMDINEQEKLKLQNYSLQEKKSIIKQFWNSNNTKNNILENRFFEKSSITQPDHLIPNNIQAYSTEIHQSSSKSYINTTSRKSNLVEQSNVLDNTKGSKPKLKKSQSEINIGSQRQKTHSFITKLSNSTVGTMETRKLTTHTEHRNDFNDKGYKHQKSSSQQSLSGWNGKETDRPIMYLTRNDNNKGHKKSNTTIPQTPFNRLNGSSTETSSSNRPSSREEIYNRLYEGTDGSKNSDLSDLSEVILKKQLSREEIYNKPEYRNVPIFFSRVSPPNSQNHSTVDVGSSSKIRKSKSLTSVALPYTSSSRDTVNSKLNSLDYQNLASNVQQRKPSVDKPMDVSDESQLPHSDHFSGLSINSFTEQVTSNKTRNNFDEIHQNIKQDYKPLQSPILEYPSENSIDSIPLRKPYRKNSLEWFIWNIADRSVSLKALLRLVSSLKVTLSLGDVDLITKFIELEIPHLSTINVTGVSCLEIALDRVCAPVMDGKSSGKKKRPNFTNSKRILPLLYSDDINPDDVRLEVIQCARIITGFEFGMNSFLNSIGLLRQMIWCFAIPRMENQVKLSKDTSLRLGRLGVIGLVAEIVGPACLLDQRLKNTIINVFQELQRYQNEPRLFYYFVSSLTNPFSFNRNEVTLEDSDIVHSLVEHSEIWTFRTQIMIFINGLVSSSDLISERIRVRNLIEACKFTLIVNWLKTLNPTEQFLNQLTAYEEDLVKDQEEVELNVQIKNLSLGDARVTLDSLLETIQGVPQSEKSQMLIQSTINHLNRIVTGLLLNQSEIPNLNGIQTTGNDTDEILSLIERTTSTIAHSVEDWSGKITDGSVVENVRADYLNEVEKSIGHVSKHNGSVRQVYQELKYLKEKYLKALDIQESQRKEIDYLKTSMTIQRSHAIQEDNRQSGNEPNDSNNPSHLIRSTDSNRMNSKQSSFTSPIYDQSPSSSSNALERRRASITSHYSFTEDNALDEIDIQDILKNSNNGVGTFSTTSPNTKFITSSEQQHYLKRNSIFSLDEETSFDFETELGIEGYQSQLERRKLLTKAPVALKRLGRGAGVGKLWEEIRRLENLVEKLSNQELTTPTESPKVITPEDTVPPPPPPPPPPPSVIPPPPPPPAIPVPPPPPSTSSGDLLDNEDTIQATISTDVSNKEEIKPKKHTLKPLQWFKVPNHIAIASMWNELSVEAYQTVQINESELLELFQKTEGKIQSAKKSIPKKQIVRMLDSKSSQNIEMLLRSYRLTNKQIQHAILSVNDSILTFERLLDLRPLIPPNELIDQIVSYEGEDGELGIAETFVACIGVIPKLPERFDAMIFRHRFRQEVDEIMPDLETVRTAIVQLTSSTTFLLLLKHILVIGNFLNDSTFRGNAKGFRIDSLLILQDTKAAPLNKRNCTTLLHYLARTLIEKAPECIDFMNEMDCVSRTAKISIPNLVSGVKELSVGLEYLGLQLENFTIKDELSENDMFLDRLTEFYTSCTKKQSMLEMESQKMEHELKALFESFAEDLQDRKDEPQLFFQAISNFGKNLQRAHAENIAVDKIIKKREEQNVSKTKFQDGELIEKKKFQPEMILQIIPDLAIPYHTLPPLPPSPFEEDEMESNLSNSSLSLRRLSKNQNRRKSSQHSKSPKATIAISVETSTSRSIKMNEDFSTDESVHDSSHYTVAQSTLEVTSLLKRGESLKKTRDTIRRAKRKSNLYTNIPDSSDSQVAYDIYSPSTSFSTSLNSHSINTSMEIKSDISVSPLSSPKLFDK
ncbi:hypothetical protein BC833DRAFT_657838 [Globomyces pollinis-pini]|nr:hypothetical protein BC833DRAFT_657838 [Globomyces pollinis-pini]